MSKYYNVYKVKPKFTLYLTLYICCFLYYLSSELMTATKFAFYCWDKISWKKNNLRKKEFVWLTYLGSQYIERSQDRDCSRGSEKCYSLSCLLMSCWVCSLIYSRAIFPGNTIYSELEPGSWIKKMFHRLARGPVWGSNSSVDILSSHTCLGCVELTKTNQYNWLSTWSPKSQIVP